MKPRFLQRLACVIRKRPKAAIAVIVALGALSWFLWPSPSSPAAGSATPETAVVTRGPLDITVETKGQFAAPRSVKLTFDTPYKRPPITFLVPDGSDVKKGDVVAKFDPSDCERRIDPTIRDMEKAQSDYTRAQEEMKITQSKAETDLSKARIKLQLAQLALAQYGSVKLRETGLPDEQAYSSGSAPPKGEAYQQFRDAMLEIDRARTELEKAQTDFRDMDLMLSKGYITKSDYLTSQLKVDEAVRKLETAQLAYNILRDYTYPRTLAEKNQAITEAENELRKTEVRTALDLTEAEAALRRAKHEEEWQKRDLERLRRDLEKYTLISPLDGTIFYGDPSLPWNDWLKREIAVGKVVWSRGQTLFSIPDLSEIIAKSALLEMDSSAVKLGQDVKITAEAVQDLTLNGKVSRVAEFASTGDRWGWFSGNAKGFDLDISLQSTDSRIKPGMSCQAEILVEHIPDALYVPVMAVFTKGDRKVCYLANGSEPEQVEVTVGRSSDKFVEILSGLQSGQTVVLAETPSSAAPPSPQGKGG